MSIRTNLFVLALIGINLASPLRADNPDKRSRIPIHVHNDSQYSVFIATNPEGYKSLRLDPNNEILITIPAPRQRTTSLSPSPSHKDQFPPRDQGIYCFYIPQKMPPKKIDEDQENRENIASLVGENDDENVNPSRKRRRRTISRENHFFDVPGTPKSAFDVHRRPATLPAQARYLEFFAIDIIDALHNPNNADSRAQLRMNNTITLHFAGPYYSYEKQAIIEEPTASLSVSF